MVSSKHMLIVGGADSNSLLKQNVINHFRSTWKIANLDTQPNANCHLNLQLKYDSSKSYLQSIENQVMQFSKHYECIMCLPGYAATSPASSKKIFAEYTQLYQAMLFPSVLSGYFASKYMSVTGCLVL